MLTLALNLICLCSKREAVPPGPVLTKSEDSEVETETLTVTEQAEVTPTLPAANQAMKGTFNINHF